MPELENEIDSKLLIKKESHQRQRLVLEYRKPMTTGYNLHSP